MTRRITAEAIVEQIVNEVRGRGTIRCPREAHDRAARIRALNDRLRTTGRGGIVLMTESVAALGLPRVNAIFAAIARFNAFARERPLWRARLRRPRPRRPEPHLEDRVLRPEPDLSLARPGLPAPDGAGHDRDARLRLLRPAALVRSIDEAVALIETICAQPGNEAPDRSGTRAGPA